MWEPLHRRDKLPQVSVKGSYFHISDTSEIDRTLYEQHPPCSIPDPPKMKVAKRKMVDTLRSRVQNSQEISYGDCCLGDPPDVKNMYIKKARFQTLAGVKGYSYRTSKRFMKSEGDVGTIRRKGQIPTSLSRDHLFKSERNTEASINRLPC